MSQQQTAAQAEYMALAPGVGIIPDDYRNRGYAKLDFEAGEGGLGALLTQPQSTPTSDGRMEAFLAGVSAGADPAKLAGELLHGNDTTPRRGGRRAQTAAA